MPVNLSQYPAHVQAAIKAIDLPRISIERAGRGIHWLDRNAPFDWRLQVMSIYGGRISSHVNLGRADEGPLSLAFRRVQAFKDLDGRVRDGTLIGPHGLISESEAEQCGFKEKRHWAPDSVVIDQYTDMDFLTEAWATVLGEYCAHYQPVRPYPAHIEEAYLLRRVAQHHAARTADHSLIGDR